MELGTRIKTLRTQKGFSQEALADRLEISRQAIAKWESGQSRPSTGNLLTLCEVFGVSLDELVSGEELAAPLPAEVPAPAPAPVQKPRQSWKMQAALLALTLVSLGFSVSTTIFTRNLHFPEQIIGGADGPTSIVVSVPYMFGVPVRTLPLWIVTVGLAILTGIVFFRERRRQK